LKHTRIICALLAVLAGACPQARAGIREKVREQRLPTYLIENQTYISLKSALRLLGADNSWGRIEDRIFFLYGGKEVKMRIDHPEVVVGDRRERVAYPPKEVEGEVLISVGSLEKVLEGGSEPAAVISISDRRREPSGDPAPAGGRKFTILIDPGHGGHDNGAVGNYGLREKDVNRDVSLRMRDHLRKLLKPYPAVKVLLTREEDVFLSLEERVRMAKAANADLFFCIHTNSSRYNRLDADGFETFFPRRKAAITSLPAPADLEGREDENGAETVVLQIVQDLNETSVMDESRILAEMVQEKLSERLTCPDRGAKPANFYVIKYTPMTSVLVEIGFICNPNIELNLRDVEVRQAIGETLGNAVVEYLRKNGVVASDG